MENNHLTLRGRKALRYIQKQLQYLRRIPGNDGAVCAGIHGRTDAKADRREFRYAKTDGSYGRERTSKEGYLLLEASEGDKREKRDRLD